MKNLEEIIKLYLETRAELTENENDVILSLLEIYSDNLRLANSPPVTIKNYSYDEKGRRKHQIDNDIYTAAVSNLERRKM